MVIYENNQGKKKSKTKSVSSGHNLDWNIRKEVEVPHWSLGD